MTIHELGPGAGVLNLIPSTPARIASIDEKANLRKVKNSPSKAVPGGKYTKMNIDKSTRTAMNTMIWMGFIISPDIRIQGYVPDIN